jgi:hypothetical protein
MIGLILQRIASAISNRSGSVQLSSDEAVASFVVSVVLARRIAVRATDQSAGRMSCIALYNITTPAPPKFWPLVKIKKPINMMHDINLAT